jgi:hypothetical protein
METQQVVDSKLQLIEYKLNSKLANTPREKVEQQLESANIKQLLAKRNSHVTG